jgi:sulfate transport system ATP-binding protein
VNAAGPVVRLDLVAAWGDPIRVEMSEDRYHALRLAGSAIELPEGQQASGHARVFVRPHLLTISHTQRGRDEFAARVVRVNAAGPLVRVDLVSALGEPVRVEITQERLQELQLQRDSEVFVGFDAADAYVAD